MTTPEKLYVIRSTSPLFEGVLYLTSLQDHGRKTTWSPSLDDARTFNAQKLKAFRATWPHVKGWRRLLTAERKRLQGAAS